jgi:hypothetical protein
VARTLAARMDPFSDVTGRSHHTLRRGGVNGQKGGSNGGVKRNSLPAKRLLCDLIQVSL